jgi:hypothetical protein
MPKEAGFQVDTDTPITPEGLIGNNTIVAEKVIRFHG